MYFDRVLQSARHHARPDKRREMIHILGRLQDPRALDPLKDFLGEKDPFIVSEAVEAIGNIGGAEAIELLKAVTDHPSFLVRSKVALAMGRINHPDCKHILNQLINDKSPYVAKCALSVQRNNCLS